jgi:hypothetical protein
VVRSRNSHRQRVTGKLRPHRALLRLLPSANSIIIETHSLHHIGVVKIAAIKYRRLLEALFDQLEVGAAELVPLGDDSEGIGTIQYLFGLLKQP